MQNIWRESFEWDDLPLWRRLLVYSLFALFFVVGYRSFAMMVDIYTTAPSKPVQTTGQAIPVYVNHGYLRYLTYEQAKDYRYWSDMTPVFLAATILAMFASVMTYRHRRERAKRRLR
jgi:hypothetical protein